MRKEVRKFVVKEDATVRDAIATIDAGARQIALVVDGNDRLLATVTDGDVRRALLRGGGLEDSVQTVMSRHPVTIRDDSPPGAAHRLMHEKVLHHVPVVDHEGKLVELAWIDDPVGAVPTSARVILMAGGLGTRLRPLTEHLPKPMLPVGGRPLLEMIIRNFADQGFTRFTVSLNYRGDLVRSHFGDGSALGVEIDYVEERERMGTAGALSLLPARPEGPFIVMNGDLLTSVRFESLLRFHEETGAVATMGAREYEVQVPYGVIQMDGSRLLSIEEKPCHRHFVNAGIYVLSPEALDLLDADTPLDMPVLFERLVERDLRASVFPLREYWMDIGRIEDLEQARNEFDSVFGT